MGEFLCEGATINLDSIKEDVALAEILSKVNLMTSPAVKKRLAARSLELKFGHLEGGNFVPPREVLLYLVR